MTEVHIDARVTVNHGWQLPIPENWTRDALCAQIDMEAFYPEGGSSPRVAKSICAECPARARCLEYALEHDEREGVWGMTTPRERRMLKRGAA